MAAVRSDRATPVATEATTMMSKSVGRGVTVTKVATRHSGESRLDQV
jgi:hypothetical protein